MRKSAPVVAIMTMTNRTYIDTCVLLLAFKGEEPLASRAMQVLDDPNRTLVVSDAVLLETIPKAHYFKNKAEIAFYEEVFNVAEKLQWNYSVLEKAFELAKEHGIAAMDAIHVAHAIDARVDSFIGGEKPTKPMYKVQDIPMVSIRAKPM